MNDFVLFQSFFNEDEAAPVVETLKRNAIEYKVEKLKQPLDSTIAGESVENKIFLTIRPRDFARANDVLDKVILDNIQLLEKDYYLFSFTNEELNDIIHKPDEWSRQDFLIARKILEDRGTAVPDEEINAIKSKRVKELARQEKGSISWIILGYLLALVGGFMALIIALPFIFAKRTLPDGNRIFMYTKATRDHGKLISAIMVIGLIINILFTDNLFFAFFGFVGHRF
ncbi:MAG TPA: hypothetical protein VF144_12175 [Chitinophagaceae bacterium]